MNETKKSSHILARMASTTLDSSEFEDQIEVCNSLLGQLSGARVLIYGGTGFIGKWLTSFLTQAQIKLNLDLEITVVSRNLALAGSILPPNVNVLTNHTAQNLRKVTHMVFGATSSTSSEPTEMNESFCLAQSAIELARKQDKRVNFINLSSGASKKVKFTHFPEKAPSDYAALKRAVEELVSFESIRGNLLGTSPRMYSFLGPLLPLDSKYAAGNFMKAALLQEPIKITGNPETLRTYLHPLEMVSSLTSLLLNPVSDSVEIGGTELVSISQLAEKINYIVGGVGVLYPEISNARNDYIPDQNYNLIENQKITINESIKRWKNWFLI